MSFSRLSSILLPAALFVVACPAQALAYLDPGSGSMLVSAVIGIAATLFFALKSFYYKASGLIYRLRGIRAAASGGNSIVIYSEGRQYWNTFKPLLQALDDAGEKALYLTSGKDDPGLTHPFAQVTARCIGQGNQAFAVLNMLEAAVCVLTTPGLDVLQIRRSPGVRHYAYLTHSVTDMAIYKLYSFDYFDSVLCSGPHQMKSLRLLEAQRGTRAKLLLQTGCPYLDVMADEFESLRMPERLTAGSKKEENRGFAGKGGPERPEVTPKATSEAVPEAAPGRARIAANGKTGQEEGERTLRVLVAPTWGANGLLSRFGLGLLEPLVKAGFAVTIRPHPQSRAVEADLLQGIERHFAACPNLAWDQSLSPLEPMIGSDALISDLSGIVFDYAFILQKPVITIAMEPDLRGLEANDLPYPAWELNKLAELGASIRPEDIASIPSVIASFPEPELFAVKMRALREESLYNFRQSGRIAAEQILAIRAETNVCQAS